MSFIDNYYLDLLEAERTIDRLRQERDDLRKLVERLRWELELATKWRDNYKSELQALGE